VCVRFSIITYLSRLGLTSSRLLLHDADSDENVGECAAPVPPVEANDQEEVDLGMSASCRSRLDFDSFSD
jgi:hypothetical protein